VRAFGETAAGSELDDSLLGRGVVFHAVDAHIGRAISRSMHSVLLFLA
jgi:hypothetical protein